MAEKARDRKNGAGAGLGVVETVEEEEDEEAREHPLEPAECEGSERNVAQRVVRQDHADRLPKIRYRDLEPRLTLTIEVLADRLQRGPYHQHENRGRAGGSVGAKPNRRSEGGAVENEPEKKRNQESRD